MSKTDIKAFNQLEGIMPGMNINVTTAARKQWLLERDAGFYMRQGRGYELKWRNLGGGVWQAYLSEKT